MVAGDFLWVTQRKSSTCLHTWRPNANLKDVPEMTEHTSKSSGTFVNKLIEPADHSPDEKGWWQSKKFIAFMATQLGFFLLMGAMIYEQEMAKIGENMAFMVLAITSGFLATGYILGQAALDKYIRVAKITMGKGDDLVPADPPKESE